MIGAGFYEEFTFRGFLMQGLAMLFGGSRGAWIIACVVQGALFGAAIGTGVGLAVDAVLPRHAAAFPRPAAVTMRIAIRF